MPALRLRAPPHSARAKEFTSCAGGFARSARETIVDVPARAKLWNLGELPHPA
jgi:hypothetical protein